MTYRPNLHPTSIYWLVDVRPETIAAGWSNGRPFYCGKTVLTLSKRFRRHWYAAKYHPRRLLSKRLNACGDHVQIHQVDVVLPLMDWAFIECRWIWILRTHFPGGANATDGGEGLLGRIQSREERTKRSRTLKAKYYVGPTPEETIRRRRINRRARFRAKNKSLNSANRC